MPLLRLPEVYADHASHARLPLRSEQGSGGRHDTYGSALTAQPGESQRRPATNTSSRLIVCTGLPAPSCSRCLCPGWSHHTASSPWPGIGTGYLIPVTNPLERLNRKIKRRTGVVGIFPNEAAITRLVGAMPLEQNDEWTVQRSRYMTLRPLPPSTMIPSSAYHPWRTDQPAMPERALAFASYTITRDTTATGRARAICPDHGVAEHGRLTCNRDWS
jgi:hypothetical protein